MVKGQNMFLALIYISYINQMSIICNGVRQVNFSLSRKNGGSCKFLTKPQYSYIQACISFLVNYGLSMTTSTVLIVLFESFGYFYFPQILEPNHFGIFRKFQNSPKWLIWGILILELKQWVLGAPYSSVKGSNMFVALIQGHINQLIMICNGVRWVGPPTIPKKGGRYELYDNTLIQLQVGLYLVFYMQCSDGVKKHDFNIFVWVLGSSL